MTVSFPTLRSSELGGARGGCNIVGYRLVRTHADAGRARLGHDGGDDGGADPVQHHAGSGAVRNQAGIGLGFDRVARSEEHTSELQSLMRISYAVFCLKKKNNNNKITPQLPT